MRAQIKPTHQIQRINSLLNRLEEFKKLNTKTLLKWPNEAAWCGAEVLKHMIIAHNVYVAKVEGALAKLKPANKEVEVVSTRAMPSFLIKRFPPQDGKIRFKMKTMKTFKPVFDINKLTEDDVNILFSEMKKTLHQLSSWVEQTRKMDVLPVRFNSAVGAWVKFNASEACEFILCHNERHFQQLKNAVSVVNA